MKEESGCVLLSEYKNREFISALEREMTPEYRNLVQLVEDPKAAADDFSHLKLPESMAAVVLHRDEQEMFSGKAFCEKDPRQALHYEEVPVPVPGPGEVLVAVMASAVNFNNVWSSIFEPAPGFSYIADFARMRVEKQKHQQDYHIIGGDAAGVVVRTHPSVHNWKPGDRVTLHGGVNDVSEPAVFYDSVQDPHGRAWGFETNFGAFAYFTVVQQHQLLPKAEHLSWEEAASMNLVTTTAYRMLVSDNGARMRQGDNVLIWGASGGLGSIAIQMVRNGGGVPIGIVSSEKKAAVVRKLGCERVIVLEREPGKDLFLDESGRTKGRQVLRLKALIRRLTDGEDCDIVFEHTGRSTFAASVAVAKAGGKVVTCGSTSGYNHVFDNRYFWQTVKKIIGSHGANYYEAAQAVRLICKGMLTPVLSEVYPLSRTADAIFKMHSGEQIGKLGILNLAPSERMGIRNRELREKIGEQRINILRTSLSGEGGAIC